MISQRKAMRQVACMCVLAVLVAGCIATPIQQARNTVYAANTAFETVYEEVLFQTYLGNLPPETEAKADALYQRYHHEWKVPAARAIALWNEQTTPQTLAELELVMIAIRRELVALLEEKK